MLNTSWNQELESIQHAASGRTLGRHPLSTIQSGHDSHSPFLTVVEINTVEDWNVTEVAGFAIPWIDWSHYWISVTNLFVCTVWCSCTIHSLALIDQPLISLHSIVSCFSYPLMLLMFITDSLVMWSNRLNIPSFSQCLPIVCILTLNSLFSWLGGYLLYASNNDRNEWQLTSIAGILNQWVWTHKGVVELILGGGGGGHVSLMGKKMLPIIVVNHVCVCVNLLHSNCHFYPGLVCPSCLCLPQNVLRMFMHCNIISSSVTVVT